MLLHCLFIVEKFQKKTTGKNVIHQTCAGDLNKLEVNTVHEKSDPNEMTITIDSGHPRTSRRSSLLR